MPGSWNGAHINQFLDAMCSKQLYKLLGSSCRVAYSVDGVHSLLYILGILLSFSAHLRASRNFDIEQFNTFTEFCNDSPVSRQYIQQPLQLRQTRLAHLSSMIEEQEQGYVYTFTFCGVDCANLKNE